MTCVSYIELPAAPQRAGCLGDALIEKPWTRHGTAQRLSILLSTLLLSTFWSQLVKSFDAVSDCRELSCAPPSFPQFPNSSIRRVSRFAIRHDPNCRPRPLTNILNTTKAGRLVVSASDWFGGSGTLFCTAFNFGLNTCLVP